MYCLEKDPSLKIVINCKIFPRAFSYSSFAFQMGLVDASKSRFKCYHAETYALLINGNGLVSFFSIAHFFLLIFFLIILLYQTAI